MSAPLERRCALCDGPLVDAGDAMAAGFSFARCTSCGTEQTLPELSDDELAHHYPQSYYGDDNRRFLGPLERVISVVHGARARTIAARCPPGRVLEVGCGRGLLLAALRSRGFDVHGVELSASAARHAREQLGLDVSTDLFDVRFEPSSYACVIFWHVLEHLRDPRAAIARAAELLAPGGLLVVAVPNKDSVQGRLFGAKWFHRDVPRHLFHFGADGLTRMLDRAGFDIESTRHLNLEQNPYGFLQSAMNALGFPENFLYSMLKTPSARQHALAAHKGLVALSALLAPPVAGASLIAALAEAGLRRGGTIEVFARRR